MGLVGFALKKPVLVFVAVVFMVSAGIWALLSIPIQLTPDIVKPQATVRTTWSGASPYEIEREIIRRQEEVLTGVPNLVRMESNARPGRASVSLEFAIGTDMDATLLRITNVMQQVTGYPDGANQPRIILSGENSSPDIWVQMRLKPGVSGNVQQFKGYAEDVVVPEFEKIQGVSEVRVYGGRDQKLQVAFDAARLASHGITIPQIIARLRAETEDFSAGDFSQGKRSYTVRTISGFRTPEALAHMVVRTTPSGPVYLGDLATVEVVFDDDGSTNRSDKGVAISLPIYREAGANVLKMTDEVAATIDRLNRGLLDRQGLELERIMDPKFYIESAIQLVLGNLYLGGFMAVLVLYLFLGNLRSSLVVAFTIPVSIITTFFFLRVMGRNINVISLAGLAFAVGMVVDSAIVVLENIDTWRKKGLPLVRAIGSAVAEVWGAILASALTTVAVFLPVVFVEDQAGQLFRDIALAIVFAIVISFMVSVLVIPPFYNLLFGNGHGRQDERVNAFVRTVRKVGRTLAQGMVSHVEWAQKRVWRKLAIVLGISSGALLLGWILMPKLEYLPSGNRNFLISVLSPPAGYNVEELGAMGDQLLEKLRPATEGPMEGFPRIERVWYLNFSTIVILGVVSEDPDRVRELIPLLNRTIRQIPGLRGFTAQTSLFERGLGTGRSIDVEIYGDRIEEIAGVSEWMFNKVPQIIPGAQARPLPSFDLGTPEIRVLANPERAAAAGLSTADLGLIVDIYTDGRKIGEYTTANGETIDMELVSADTHLNTVQDFDTQLLLTPQNRLVTIGSVADVSETVGPDRIDHIGQKRAFVLRVLPPDGIPLETTLQTLQDQLVAPANAQFQNVSGLHIALSGSADAFTKTRESLQSGFIVALAITFLLLVVLFEDLLSPLVIMGALPVAGAGGLIALWLVNTIMVEQPLDMLTMLGFVMLIGIVVNNPILIVAKALSLMREDGWDLGPAVVEGVRSRIRPIFMTTSTSVFGLLPLVLMPGAGSELYRGLGSAVLGGLALSTLVNVIFVPSLFSLLQDFLALFGLHAGARRHDPAEAAD